MNAITMPGFTAEASLNRSLGQYASEFRQSKAAMSSGFLYSGVVPQHRRYHRRHDWQFFTGAPPGALLRTVGPDCQGEGQKAYDDCLSRNKCDTEDLDCCGFGNCCANCQTEFNSAFSQCCDDRCYPNPNCDSCDGVHVPKGPCWE
jgi:hypothetical protein